MRKWGLLVGAVALCASGHARADGTWSCSVIEDGKAQVIKIVVTKGAATVSDWRSRIVAKFMVGIGSDPFRVIADNADALVVASETHVMKAQGQIQNVNIDIIAINKNTDEMTLTTVATAYNAMEIKGRCTQ